MLYCSNLYTEGIDPKHGFLSSVEAEIISFCQRKQPFAFSAFYVHPLTFEGGSPTKFDK